MPAFAALARELSAHSGLRCAAYPAQRLSGAGVSESYHWPCETGEALLVKVASLSRRAALEAEAAGLAALAATKALRVPRVLASGTTGDCVFLALEWIEAVPAAAIAEGRLGEGLAALHAVLAPRFGWERDNTIGASAQMNGWMSDWTEFFRERRLRPQLELAVQNGFGGLIGEPGERLLGSLPLLLGAHAPQPSLLHGDLWGGNWLATTDDEPVIFDPAVYYGDRETDVAMTRLFGGFGAAFYRAYESAAPLPAGAQTRAELYNLYHVLNHANLFGSGYARAARAMIDRLLAQLRG
jgi:protein-ribulosamine 3-kinase